MLSDLRDAFTSLKEFGKQEVRERAAAKKKHAAIEAGLRNRMNKLEEGLRCVRRASKPVAAAVAAAKKVLLFEKAEAVLTAAKLPGLLDILAQGLVKKQASSWRCFLRVRAHCRPFLSSRPE